MLPHFRVLRSLTSDGRRLFVTRCVRLFAYGFLSVVLVLYLHRLGFDDWRVGCLLMLTLLGDTAISLWLTTTADRVGRRKMLIVGALLMLLAGVVFAVTRDFWWLLAAATIGVISPSGNEVGPFLSIEQAALSQIVTDRERTEVFAWYNLIGSVATAWGALAGGAVCQASAYLGLQGPDIYRPLIVAYALAGIVLAVMFLGLSPRTEVGGGLAEAARVPIGRFGLSKSRGIVARLAGLFALDAFGGGFVIQSIVAYWFHVRFGVEPVTLGSIFFGANVLAGLSSLAAAGLASRFGLINTMVFTHLPSNGLLILVPLMPNLPLAIALLWIRFSISQMDVPTRQSYTMAVVTPDERSAAAGVTGVARSIGAAVSPLLAALFVGSPAWASVPFFLAGGIKIVYDLLLYRSFVTLKPPEEMAG